MSELQPIINIVFFRSGWEGDYFHTITPCIGVDGVKKAAGKSDDVPVVLFDGQGKSIVIDYDAGGLDEALKLWH